MAQIQVAAQLGLAVPPTLITSSGREARAFVKHHRNVLYKPLTSAFLRENDSVKLVYANLITADELDDASIALSPCQFQAFVPKSRDIPLVAVGQECFAVAIHAGSDASYLDWRSDYPTLSYEAVETPKHIAAAVTVYLKRFGLSFGCFDFSVSKEAGSWVFLECGPNAQWGWLENETGLAIADAIAGQLEKESA